MVDHLLFQARLSSLQLVPLLFHLLQLLAQPFLQLMLFFVVRQIFR